MQRTSRFTGVNGDRVSYYEFVAGVDADQAGYHLYENSSLESYRLQRTYEDRTTWIEDE